MMKSAEDRSYPRSQNAFRRYEKILNTYDPSGESFLQAPLRPAVFSGHWTEKGHDLQGVSWDLEGVAVTEQQVYVGHAPGLSFLLFSWPHVYTV